MNGWINQPMNEQMNKGYKIPYKIDIQIYIKTPIYPNHSFAVAVYPEAFYLISLNQLIKYFIQT